MRFMRAHSSWLWLHFDSLADWATMIGRYCHSNWPRGRLSSDGRWVVIAVLIFRRRSWPRNGPRHVITRRGSSVSSSHHSGMSTSHGTHWGTVCTRRRRAPGWSSIRPPTAISPSRWITTPSARKPWRRGPSPRADTAVGILIAQTRIGWWSLRTRNTSIIRRRVIGCHISPRPGVLVIGHWRVRMNSP